MEDWDTFYAEAEKLFLEHPDHTRYVTKYRHVDGKLELKVTNDRVCLKFVTDQQQDLKRIEKLNNLFLTYMVGKDPQLEPPEGGRRVLLCYAFTNFMASRHFECVQSCGR